MYLKSFKQIVCLGIMIMLSACGFGHSDESPSTEASIMPLPKIIAQSRLLDTGTINVFISVDNGTRQSMVVNGTSASITLSGIAKGSHDFTIIITYTPNSDPGNSITLVETTKTLSISSGSNTGLSFTDEDHEPNYPSFDDDNDLISNLDELLAGSNPFQADLLRELPENVLEIPSFPPNSIATPATFSITAGDDSSLFSIDTSSGSFSFVNAPDFETPLDFNLDNKYLVTVTVVNSDGTTILPVFVSVTDQALSDFKVTYPTANSNLGGEVIQASITGKIVSESTPLDEQDIEFIEVNGTIATLDQDDPTIWTAKISVDPELAADPRDIPLTVSYQLTNGASGDISSNLSNEPLIDDFTRKSDVDRVNQRLIVANRDRDILIAIDLSETSNEGTKIVISDNSGGDILELGDIIAYDEINNKAYTANDAGAIFVVDLIDGNREIVSFFGGGGRGSGPEIQDPRDIVIDSANNRAFVSEGFDMDKIYVVALDTGDRSIFSFSDTGSGVGSGPGFNGIQGIALDSINSRLLVVDADDIIQVNLNNGDRTATNADLKAFSELSGGMPNDVTIEPGADIAYVVVRQAVFNPVSGNDEPQIVKVELASGITTKLSGVGPTLGEIAGTGPTFLDLDSIDAIGNDVIAPDSLNASILKVNRSSGNRTFLTDNSTVPGLTDTVPSLLTPGSLAEDSDNFRLLVIDSGLNAIMAVDLFTGERSIFSNSLTGSGPVFQSPEYIIIDKTDNRALVTDSTLNAVVAVDLSSGNRSIVTDNSVSFTGQEIDRITGITLDTANNRIIIATQDPLDPTNDFLLTVDPGNGNRGVLTDNSASFPGPDFNLPEDIIFDDRDDLDTNNDRILVIDGLSILAVNNNTGEKIIFSDNISSLRDKDFEQIRGLALDTLNDQLLVLDRNVTDNVDEFQLVDLDTGFRTLLAINPISLNPGSQSGLVLDNENNRAFITSNSLNAVIIIDLVSGESAIMSL